MLDLQSKLPAVAAECAVYRQNSLINLVFMPDRWMFSSQREWTAGNGQI